MERYERYKTTNNLWYPEIPLNWVLSKVKYIATTYAGGTPSTNVIEYWENGAIPWLQSGKLQNRNIVSAEKFITEEGLNNSSTKWIKANTTLVALTGATCANIGYLTFKACANQSVVAINEFDDKADSRFLYYAFLSIRNQILTHQTGGAQAGINDGDVKNLYLMVPSLQEQIQIARYLDYQCNIIDALMSKKERLIELLKEKRKSIINESVTKGINPNARMKDSGIEWLCEIPEEWKLNRLKFLVELNNNQIPIAANENIFKIALENIESFTGKYIKSSENEFEGIGNSFKKNDILFNKLRPYLSKVHLAKREGMSVGELLVLTPKKNINSNFLFYRLLSSEFIEVVNSSTYGAKMPRASWNFIGNLFIPLPSIKEQIEIVKFIYENLNENELLSSKLKVQIQKLREYRRSIISEIVTGKIDVRDWEPKESVINVNTAQSLKQHSSTRKTNL